MREPTDEAVEARLRAAAPADAETDACIASPEFDVGRLDDWRAGRAPGDAEDVTAHLADCPHCRDLLANLQPMTAAELAPMAAAVPSTGGWLFGGAVLAAAAALLLTFWPAGAPLPSYHPEPPTGGIALVKGPGATRTAAYGPESRLVWLLRAVSRTPAPPARAYIQDGDHLRALPDAWLVRLEGGGLRLEADAADLFRGPAGERTLRVGIASHVGDLAADGDRWPGSLAGVWYAVTVRWEGGSE